MTRKNEIHSLKCCQQAKALLERVLGMITTCLAAVSARQAEADAWKTLQCARSAVKFSIHAHTEADLVRSGDHQAQGATQADNDTGAAIVLKPRPPTCQTTRPP
jgi:hypothetical protein